MPKQTGYFIEDRADIMARLRDGTATPEDQRLAALALEECDLYQDFYTNLSDMIEPYVYRGPDDRPARLFPASITSAVEIMLAAWVETPEVSEATWALIRKGLTTGARYRLKACEDALAKLDARSARGQSQRASRALLDMRSVTPGFPTRLKEVREKAGFTTGELGYKCAIPGVSIIAYEAGRVKPHPRTIRKIVKVLGASQQYVMQGEEPKGVTLPKNTQRAHDEESE